MSAETTSVSAFTIITSSAFIGASVNVAWNALAKWHDRRREEQKEALKVGHVYHAVILQLESFAHRCNEQLYDISVAMDLYRSQHDTNAFDRVKAARFEFSPEPEWTALPIPFVDKMKSFVNRSDQCDKWIRTQFDLWAGLDEAYELEEQRLAHYGLHACTLASGIRLKIKAGESELGDLVEHFRSTVDDWRTYYEKNDQRANLIPELRAKFESALATT